MRKGDPPTFVGHSRLQSAKAEARRAPGLRSRSCCFGGVGKEGASADCAKEMKDTTGVSPGGLHLNHKTGYLEPMVKVAIEDHDLVEFRFFI